MDSLKDYLIRITAHTSGINEAVSGMKNLGKQIAITMIGVKSLASIVLKAANVVKANIKETVKLNDSLEETAKSLNKTTQQARAHQIALSVMGKTMQEINKSDRLKKTYNELIAINDAFKFESAPEGAVSIRDLGDELNKIKFTAKLGLSQVYEYFKKYAAEPLQQFRNWLRDLAQKLGVNLKEQARKIGEFAAKVFKELSFHFQHIIGVLGQLWNWASRLLKWWDSMSKGAKTASVAILGAIALITGKLKPLHAMLAAIYLLIDDFVVWSQGGDSYLGNTWNSISEVFSKIGEYLDNDIAKAVTLVAVLSQIASSGKGGGFLNNLLGGNGNNGSSGNGSSSGGLLGTIIGGVKSAIKWVFGHPGVAATAGAATYLLTQKTEGDGEDEAQMQAAMDSVGWKWNKDGGYEGSWADFTSRYYQDSKSGKWLPFDWAYEDYKPASNAYPPYTNKESNNTENNNNVTVNVQSTFNVTTSDPSAAANQVNSSLASEVASNVESALA